MVSGLRERDGHSSLAGLPRGMVVLEHFAEGRRQNAERRTQNAEKTNPLVRSTGMSPPEAWGLFLAVTIYGKH